MQKLSSHSDTIKPECLAWHYTIGLYIHSIFENEELRPTNAYIESGEKPIVWFSKNPLWEPTACKGAYDKGGKYRLLSMKETGEAGGGLFRFGAPVERLIPWPKLASVAKIRPKLRKGLEDAGREQGANPRHWYGAVQSISIFGLIGERMNDQGQWVNLMEWMNSLQEAGE